MLWYRFREGVCTSNQVRAMSEQPSFRKRVFSFLLCYGFWILTMVLGFLALVGGRDLGIAVFALFSANLKLAILVDKVGFFFFGVLGLAIIVLSEGYYRQGVQKGLLPERFGLVLGMELLFLTGCHGTLLLLPGLDPAVRPNFWMVMSEGTIGFLGLSVFFRARRARATNVSVGGGGYADT